MAAADLRHTHAGLFRLQHDCELLFIREAAPVRTSVVRRIRIACCCQVVFRRALLSSAASTSAYFWAGTRMKMRPPVDLHLGVLETVPPFAQACRRKLQAGGILANSHAAAVHCFRMRRPEPLDRTRTDICAHRVAPLLTPFAVLSSLLAPLFRAQFTQVFCRLTGSSLTRCFIQRPNVLIESP